MLFPLGEREEVWNFQVGKKTCHKVILKVPLLLAVRGIEVLWFPGGISVNKNVDFQREANVQEGNLTVGKCVGKSQMSTKRGVARRAINPGMRNWVGRKINREGVWDSENFETHCKLGSLKPIRRQLAKGSFQATNQNYLRSWCLGLIDSLGNWLKESSGWKHRAKQGPENFRAIDQQWSDVHRE